MGCASLRPARPWFFPSYNACPVEINGVSTPTKGWIDDVSTDFAIGWMKQKRERAFSLVVGFKSPHSPRGGNNLPARLRNLYTGATSRPTPNFGVPASFHPPDPAGAKQSQGLADNAIHLDYLRHVTGADENLGRLLDAAELDTQVKAANYAEPANVDKPAAPRP